MSCHCSFTGLQISRFCLCSEDKLVESLLQNQVHLFLTTDPNEVQQASLKGQEVSSFITVDCEGEDRLVVMISDIYLRFTIGRICSGVVSVLLDQELAFCPSDQLRVMICGDAITQPNSGQQHLQVRLRIISMISGFYFLFFLFLTNSALCYWIVKEDFTLVCCRVSWLIWVRCGRGLTSPTPLSPLSWWRHMVTGTAALAPWRSCDPMECLWTRRIVWPGPHEGPSCLCSDLTSCSMAALAAWRSYEVTTWDWSVWTNLPGRCQCNSETQ